MAERASDPKPDASIRFVRASVANRCNLSCVYCPKSSGMENHVPPAYENRRLSTQGYCKNLEHLAYSGVIQGISFTGGEPTLNPDLPVLVEHARGVFRRVELTTNGRFLPQQIRKLAPHLDVLKVSLDAVDPALSQEIMRGRTADHVRAQDAIRAALDCGVSVGINVVAMRQNMHQIQGIINWARELQAETSGTLYVSILDLYYSDEQRDVWCREFVPLDPVIDEFRSQHVPGLTQDRKGCEIEWFDCDGVDVRFKNSYGSTYRAARCDKCPIYCQEGFYGLKHSVEGWVTPCPTGQEEYGVYLEEGLTSDEVQQRLQPLMDELLSTRRVDDSFAQFLERRGLTFSSSG